MFKVPKIKVILIPLGIVTALKLFFKPFLAGSISTFLAFPELWKEVLVLLAAMPPAILGAVFIRRSGGDAALASSLLLAATIISSGTLLLVFWFIGYIWIAVLCGREHFIDKEYVLSKSVLLYINWIAAVCCNSYFILVE
jgi:hypothetical protein